MGSVVTDRLSITNDTRYLIAMRDFVARILQRSRLPELDRHKVVLAVDEAVTNVIEHGYGPGQRGEIEVQVEIQTDRVVVRVFDEGRSFDPSMVREVDMERHVRAGRKKGLGIFLIRRIMDEVNYSVRDRVRNELRLVKYIRPEA